MIDAIYASKLYRTSKRKAAIVAAANNPINTELVTQLADALSPVYKKEKYLVNPEIDEAKSEAVEIREQEEGTAKSERLDSKPSNTRPHKPSHLADSFRKAEEREDESQMLETETKSESAEVENSSKTDKSCVTATRMLTIDMRQVANEVKNLLNLQDSTSSVNRILVKDSEMWIYYNDAINLNNVMADVIELLNASGYTYLEFNRLARSDNAIVFQILFKDTAAEVKSIDNTEGS